MSDEIEPGRISSQQLTGDALGVSDLLQIVRYFGFIAGWIGRVQADELD